MQLLQILFDLRYFMIVLVVVLAMFGDMLNIGEFSSPGCFQNVSIVRLTRRPFLSQRYLQRTMVRVKGFYAQV
jgi:hypothetical protein